MTKRLIIGALIAISVILFISFPFLYHLLLKSPERLPFATVIKSDSNISVWQDEACMNSLYKISWEEIKSKRIDTIVFCIRNDYQHAVVATWEDNIYGDYQSVMKCWDEKNRTWWAWPEYISAEPNYGLYLKPRQVFKVVYELGPVLPMRISIWSMKYPENEE